MQCVRDPFKFSSLDNMSQILDFIREEPTIFDFERNARCFQAVKDTFYMIEVFFHCDRVNDNVIRINEGLFSFSLCKDDVRSVLKGRMCVCRAESPK